MATINKNVNVFAPIAFISATRLLLLWEIQHTLLHSGTTDDEKFNMIKESLEEHSSLLIATAEEEKIIALLEE